MVQPSPEYGRLLEGIVVVYFFTELVHEEV